jgi:hypothetical protein
MTSLNELKNTQAFDPTFQKPEGLFPRQTIFSISVLLDIIQENKRV